MRFNEIIKSSLSTLKMNGRRTFLTMFGIIIGIAAVITIMSLGNGFRQQAMDELAKDELGRRSQDFYYNFTNYEADVEKIMPFNQDNIDYIQQIDGVDEVKESSEAQTDIYTEIKVRHDVEPIFTEVKLASETNYAMLAGRNLSRVDTDVKNQYVLINNSMAFDYFEGSEHALGQALTIENQMYTIIGVYEPEVPELEFSIGRGGSDMWMLQLTIPQGAYQKRQGPQVAFDLTVYFRDDANMQAISRDIKRYLNEHGAALDDGSYDYYDMSELMEEIGNTLNMITYFISAIAGISLFIAGVGVMNMMYISVSERTKEIGIRRSLGATRRSIQWQFLLEGIAITTLGGLIGYGFGFGLSKIISRFLPFNALTDVKTALLSVIISVSIGIIFSVFPSRQAAKKNVIEILR